MRIVIDQDLGPGGYVMAQHVVHLDNLPGNTHPHPSTGVPTQILVVFAFLNANPAIRLAGGFSVATQNLGEATPTTRWARLVAAANAAGADPAVKALGLSGV